MGLVDSDYAQMGAIVFGGISGSSAVGFAPPWAAAVFGTLAGISAALAAYLKSKGM